MNTNTGNKLEPSILGKIIADKIDSAAVRNFVRQKEFRPKMKDGTPIPEDYWPPASQELNQIKNTRKSLGQ